MGSERIVINLETLLPKSYAIILLSYGLDKENWWTCSCLQAECSTALWTRSRLWQSTWSCWSHWIKAVTDFVLLTLFPLSMTMTDTASTYYLGQPHLGRLLNCLESLWKETPIVHLKLSNINRVYCTSDRTKRICFTNHSLTEGIISTTAKKFKGVIQNLRIWRLRVFGVL